MSSVESIVQYIQYKFNYTIYILYNVKLNRFVNISILQELEFFDRYSLTNEQLQQLGQIVHSPEFVPVSVREVSKACESLCRWVKALYDFCCMQHRLTVKKQLEELAREKRGQLHLARQHKEDEYSHLEDKELQLQFIQQDLEKQMLALCKYKSMEEEVTRVARQVEMHLRDWKAAAQVTQTLQILSYI